MDNKILEELYYAYIGTTTYSSSEDYIDVEEYDEVQQKIRIILHGEMYYKIDDLIMDAEIEREKFGFIIGFKYAMRLMHECTM